MDVERKRKHRYPAVKNAQPPTEPYKLVMSDLGIPLREAKRRQMAPCHTICAGPGSAFVEYPIWWNEYAVPVAGPDQAGKRVIRLKPLVNFVFENVHHAATHGYGRLPTVYLDNSDLERLEPSCLVGKKAVKVEVGY